MICSGQAVGVLLRDYFSLLRDAHPARERARRQRFQEEMRRTRAAPHGSAASVKKRKAHLIQPRDFRESTLRAIKGPLAGEDPTVFIAVAVAQHDDRFGGLLVLLVKNTTARPFESSTPSEFCRSVEFGWVSV